MQGNCTVQCILCCTVYCTFTMLSIIIPTRPGLSNSPDNQTTYLMSYVTWKKYRQTNSKHNPSLQHQDQFSFLFSGYQRVGILGFENLHYGGCYPDHSGYVLVSAAQILARLGQGDKDSSYIAMQEQERLQKRNSSKCFRFLFLRHKILQYHKLHKINKNGLDQPFKT